MTHQQEARDLLIGLLQLAIQNLYGGTLKEESKSAHINLILEAQKFLNQPEVQDEPLAAVIEHRGQDYYCVRSSGRMRVILIDEARAEGDDSKRCVLDGVEVTVHDQVLEVPAVDGASGVDQAYVASIIEQLDRHRGTMLKAHNEAELAETLFEELVGLGESSFKAEGRQQLKMLAQDEGLAVYARQVLDARALIGERPFAFMTHLDNATLQAIAGGRIDLKALAQKAIKPVQEGQQ